jgi:hypothetical protein
MEHFEKMALDTSQYKPSHAFIEVREASDWKNSETTSVDICSYFSSVYHGHFSVSHSSAVVIFNFYGFSSQWDVEKLVTLDILWEFSALSYTDSLGTV